MAGERRGDHGVFLQDLLSNALAAVIVLTLITLAVSRAVGEHAEVRLREREQARVRPVRGFRMDQARVDRYDDALSAVILQVEVQGSGEGPELLIVGINAPQGIDEAIHWRGGIEGRDHVFMIPVSPDDGGLRSWEIRLNRVIGPATLRWRVVADEVVLLEGGQDVEPQGGEPSQSVLAVCLGVAGEVSVVPAGWNAPTSCAGGA